ncbi:DUF7282 domain-containing protein [Halorussus salinus]|uniref:DUF7282 domain-containing protein n=1 Tax=Halorussus salinus TaxID=1364935 RepID=UPI0010922ED9|nr:hypothetical protein [Halorussus salinus]
MTRDTKTLSAVFMAVLLVLASGTAVSLAVTESPTDAGTNAVGVQETTTAADGEETTVADDEQTTREADAPADGEASVTFDEQESDGEQVVVESATLPEGGFIAIHDSSVAEAPLSSVLGNSVYLEPGTHEDVTITLARPITESQTLVAMPHFDTNDNEVYDFVLSTGEVDGPYTVDNEILIDQGNVTVAEETTTTTEEEAEETTTEMVEETTTEAEDAEETTTEDEVVEETTTEMVEETTTEEDGAEVGETTTVAEEPPADMQQFVFKIEQMNIDRWSFVVGDEETPDRTERVGNLTISDRRVTINLSELLRQGSMAQQEAGQVTTVSPEQAEEMIEENLSQDIQTVRYIIENVNVENVTFVVTAPEDIEMPEPPMTTTTAEPEETTTEEVVEETTTEEEVEETTTEEVVEETTTEEEVEETTTTEEDGEVVEETTTEEVVEETTTEEEVEETTTTEEVVEETTTEEVVEETTTEEEVEETTTEEVVEETTTTEEEVEETTTTEETTAAEVNSFEVSELDAPDSATTGDTITVSATVSNPNDQQATQEVAFRLEGTVVARQSVTLDAGEQTTAEFEIDTEGVPAGQYIHGVYTRNFGELGVIVLEDPSAETTTTAADAGNETTTAAA